MNNDKKKVTKLKSGDFVGEKQQWWKDKQLIEELDRRYKALEDGTDEGFTIEQLKSSIEKRKSR